MRGFLRGVSLGGVIAVGGLAVASQLAGPRDSLPTEAPPNEQSPATVPDIPQEPVTPKPVTLDSETNNPVVKDTATSDASAPKISEPSPPEPGATSPADSASQATTAMVKADPPTALGQTPPAVQAEAPTSPEGNIALDGMANTPVADADTPPSAEATAAPQLTAEADPTLDAPSIPAEPPSRPQFDAPADQLAVADIGEGAVAEVPAQIPSAGPLAAVPRAPGTPEAEVAPIAAELPPPPPLTPEEEALLQPLPQDSADPGLPDPSVSIVEAPAEVSPDPRIADAAPVEPPLATAEIGPTQESLPPVSPGEPAAPLPRASGLADQAEGVVTGRLPRIGTSDPAPAIETPAAIPETVPLDPQGLGPLQRFARPFENPDSKPLFAILLVDEGDDVNRAELASLSLPLTVVIDPLSEGAAEREAIWRAGGQEVVLSVSGIPQGATASDLEQTFQQLLERLPEALAVIDPDGRMFQDNRPLATMVVPILQAEGLGLVTYDRGLNAADQVARRSGLGAARIFRKLDAEGEAVPVIRRYLDRAAFKAAQEGQVVVIGTLRDETVKAIMEWAVEGRSATVALAPVSALMAR